MRLFHVSEERDISIFHPRLPNRKDMDPNKGLVWAINERCLPNFLTPRNCPRVTYHCNLTTTDEDKRKFMSSHSTNHVVAIEHAWFETMKNTTLFLYELDPSGFYLLDHGAGYYVSETAQTPIDKIEVPDAFAELFRRNVEVRLLHNLWDLSDQVQQSTLDWSMCRMGFAAQR